jgi:hypothetical protein
VQGGESLPQQLQVVDLGDLSGLHFPQLRAGDRVNCVQLKTRSGFSTSRLSEDNPRSSRLEESAFSVNEATTECTVLFGLDAAAR